MSTPSATRSCLSPATALCFVVVALTGVLMFFHVRLPAIRLLHELLSLVLVVVGTWHLVLNFRCLLHYLATRAARITLGVGLLVCTLLVVLGLSHDEHEGRGRGPHGRGSAMGEAHRHY
jgi:hypothetical protein